MAQEKGYFADQNLNVSLIEGEPGMNIIDSVTTGAADFAVAAPNELITRVAEGDQIKAISTIYQISPVVYVSMADSGITQPQDFIGKKVAAIGNSDYEIQLRAMLDFLDIDINQVTLMEHGYSTEQLASGEIDVHGYYSIGGLLRLQNQGYDVNLIYPGDYGLHLNADAIIAPQTMLDEKPEVVTRFVRAMTEGWHYAVENVDETVEIIMQYALESDADLQRQMLEASIPLISTGSNLIGALDETTWQTMHDALLKQGYIDQHVPLTDVLDPSFIEMANIE